MATFGIGITTSVDESGEVGIRRAFVRDGNTGRWYYVETTLSGIGSGSLPGTASLVFQSADHGGT